MNLAFGRQWLGSGPRWAILAGLVVAAAATGQQAAQTFYEFGTVVALGRGSVEIQTFDESRGKTVQHSFILSKETRADVFHINDTVEVIYTPTASDWVLKRLVVLAGGIPQPGRPVTGGVQVASAAMPGPGAAGPAAKVPGKASVTIPGQSAGKGRTAAQAGSVTLPGQAAGRAGTATAGSVAMPSAAAGRVASGSVASVDLGKTAVARVPGAVSVAMGGVADPVSATPPAMHTKSVAHDRPSEECNRSDADWPNQPVRIAILDFRYPTEREESHDVGTTGGGAGTAVADIVFDRLSQMNDFAWSRGDRDKLYRADFAGAARVGRQLGVDAVLAGTFFPVQAPPDADGFVPPVKAYELRAGLVDTCTGQLLMRLSSAVCPGGIDLGGTQSGCTRYSVTTKQAADPKAVETAFKPSLDALLIPLEHEGTPPGMKGSAGTVVGVQGATISVKLDGKVKVGDQVALHAWRLTKNPTTYTLHLLKDEEIGRVTISSVSGGTATGSYVGDFVPKVGDTAELVVE